MVPTWKLSIVLEEPFILDNDHFNDSRQAGANTYVHWITNPFTIPYLYTFITTLIHLFTLNAVSTYHIWSYHNG